MGVFVQGEDLNVSKNILKVSKIDIQVSILPAYLSLL